MGTNADLDGLTDQDLQDVCAAALDSAAAFFAELPVDWLEDWVNLPAVDCTRHGPKGTTIRGPVTAECESPSADPLSPV